MRKAAQVLLVALAVVALGLALTACGDEVDPEEAKQQLRTDLDAFKASLEDMKALSVNSTVDDWQAAKADAQAAWDTAVESAKDVKEAEMDEVEAAWDDLAQTIDDVSGDTPVAEIVPSIVDKIDALRAAYEDLRNGLE
jgi:GTPase involved in cell partitioning and DNA repair